MEKQENFWYLLGLAESGNLASKVHAEFILKMLIIDTEQWVSHFMWCCVSGISKLFQYWGWREGNPLPL